MNYDIDTLKDSYLYKFQLFTTCDMGYFNTHAQKLLISINENSPGTKVVLHIINPDETVNTKIDLYRKKLKSTAIVIIKEYIDLSRYTVEEQRTYYAVYRYVALAEYFAQSKIDTYLTDIDAYVKKDLLILRRETDNCDISLHFRLNLQYQRRLLSGSVFLRYNEIVSDMLNNMAKRYIKKGISHLWMADQVIFWEVIADYSNKLRIGQLDAKFVSWRMSTDAVIWTAKGERKEDSKYLAYGKELLKYYKKEKDICILAPRVDHAFKDTVPINFETMNKREREEVRVYWMYFAKLIYNTLKEAGHNVEILMRPSWEFTEEYIKLLPHKVIYVPHKSIHQIKDDRTIFYMQELYSDFFTTDKQGWAGSSSKHKCFDYMKEEVNKKTINFIDNIKNKKISKYKQLNSKGNHKFEIFFPLQISHDETLKYHSKYELIEIIEFVAKWAIQNEKHILFKKHPYDNKLKYIKNKNIFKSKYITIVNDGNIHDYIQQSKCIFLANSGVGFESLLYSKPIVTFADAIYDVVTFNCDLGTDDLSNLYNDTQLQNLTLLEEEYHRFIQWYIFKEGMSIKGKTINMYLEIENVKDIKNIYFEDINSLINPTLSENITSKVIKQAKKDGLLGFRKVAQNLIPFIKRNHKWD